jgi:two-component system sensor kinase FixL
VLLNLVRNAVEAVADAAGDRRHVEVRTRAVDGGEEVSVEDHGRGVAPDIEEQLFHPFVTTKPGGLGMGLSISQSIVTAHGGTLSFSRNEDGGSTFRFVLPPAADEPR